MAFYDLQKKSYFYRFPISSWARAVLSSVKNHSGPKCGDRGMIAATFIFLPYESHKNFGHQNVINFQLLSILIKYQRTKQGNEALSVNTNCLTPK